MKRLTAIRTQPLSLDEVVAAVTRPEAGAIATFLGLVRNHADGRPVTLLEYEAYPSMAEKEMMRIAAAIEADSPHVKLAVLHRIGALKVGDLAVVCAASSPHRPEAFQACRALIDRIKETVPIWKREHGPEGPLWVGWRDARCATDAKHDSAGRAHRHDSTLADTSCRMERAAPLSGLGLAILTVSDSRSPTSDESGQLARHLLSEAGAEVTASAIVPDEPAIISAWIHEQSQRGTARGLIVTGGTGIANRDQTIEALLPLFSRTLDGFGEAFRRLSFDQIGPRAVLSRAVAGVVGSCLVFALPGSPRAVELALRELIVPILPHAVAILQGHSLHHHADSSHER